jgi:hypothetical protein
VRILWVVVMVVVLAGLVVVVLRLLVLLVFGCLTSWFVVRSVPWSCSFWW